MTANEIQTKIESLENEILQLETQIGKLESDITSCDNKIASKESLLSRAKSSSMQKTYSNNISSEKKRRLQKCKKRDTLRRRLNEKKKELINVQRLIPDKEDYTNNNLIMDTIRPEDKIYQIFVSSTFEDLKEARQEVMSAIVGTNNVPIGMEYFPAGDASQFEYIKQLIDKADYYLVVIAGKYGSINKDTGISYTEMEFNYAVEKKVPIAVFQYNDILKLPGEKLELDTQKRELLYKFRESSKENRVIAFWGNLEELHRKVKDAILNMIKNSPRPGWIKADMIPISQQSVEQDFDFDFDSTVELHYHYSPDPFDLDDTNQEEKDENKVVTWKEIIKELGREFIAPTSLYNINAIIGGLFGGMDEPCVRKVLDTLVNLEILKIEISNTEEFGAENICVWTTKGFKLKASFTVEA
ncbi:MAG: DUF4062 domain-containing protein [Bacteroidales bacterium]|nr:DUF4062 domain-containing protein [Bacteroidales bacterium]